MMGFLWDQLPLPETNILAPEHGWLELVGSFLLGRPIFRGELLVSRRVGSVDIYTSNPFIQWVILS